MNLKFTYSNRSAAKLGKLIDENKQSGEFKNLKATIAESENLLLRTLTASRPAVANRPALKDISNVGESKENSEKEMFRISSCRTDELPSILSSPYTKGKKITKKARSSERLKNINAPAEINEKFVARPYRRYKGKTRKVNEFASAPNELNGARRDSDLEIIIRPQDICGSGIIWVRHEA